MGIHVRISGRLCRRESSTSWLRFFLTLHLAALVTDPEKKNSLGFACVTPLCRVLSPLNWCPGAAWLFTAKKLLKLHKVEKQKALGSFRESRVVRFCGQDPPWSRSRVSHARHVGAAAGSLQHVRRLGDDAGSLHQAVEGRQSWLRDTDLPLHFRESELLKREAPGRTVQGKVRFSRACPHPNIQ